MSVERIPYLLERMRQAATDAQFMIDGVNKEEFLANVILQRAVGMSLLMASEIASQLIKIHPEFTLEHPEFPWGAMRGMRSRIAHGYFDIDLDKVWATAKDDVPDLLNRLDLVRNWRAEGE
ncbi:MULTISPECIES: HepT-like ribonuclease domain-containing protein [unclassified Rhizobium]|uniref:HepT-like ribonuclease domain-containing protein n=1 Tax=unclassified Rhizobium TaxID=2613769 RepID=UPI001607400A|nr:MULTISPECIES: HepT-like ribonuclease domain-containing protein [unclassified Rhizobium]MBB3541045.1 uncharacterized protein with HEPN domain [Rhizobium sp. BK399]MCS3741298.1 uncharacterized protein with HEPN domain [Rhizobium sp. BK661]MCS4093751.1 uncharacterized protein with HEPN domain [Rhizobium sp. BK176]